MARVLVARQAWGVLWEKDPTSRVLSIPLTGHAASISTTVYSASTGGTTVAFVTNSDGELPGWVEEGTHTLTVDGVAKTVEAVSGAVPARVTTLESGRALKPGGAIGVFGTQIQFVSEKEGVDTNDGLSWGSAKKEIQAAIAATPNGGLIFVAPGSYRPLATLVLNGHKLISLSSPLGGVQVNKLATIQHNFNGDLIDIQRGGGLSGFFLLQGGNYTGTAITATSTTAARTGGIYINDVTISGSPHGFTRDIIMDGVNDSTAGGPGIRSLFFTNVQCFGSKTTGETVVLRRVIHGFFTNCEIIQAPETTVTQGLKIEDTQTEALHWVGGYIIGNVSTAAAGNTEIGGTISGNAQCESGSANNTFTGRVTGTFSNFGAATNHESGAFPRAVRAKKTAAQSLTNGTLTAIAWEAADDFDTDAMHDTVTANTRLNCTKAGRYRVYGTIVFAPGAAGERGIVFRVTGATYVGGQQIAANSTVANNTVLSASTTCTLAVGDYVECMGEQVTGGVLNVVASSSSLGIPSHFGMELIT